MWYLIAMLEFTLLYAVIRIVVMKVCKRQREFIVTIVCAGIMALGFCSIDFPRMLNRAFVLLMFYHLGFLVKSHRDEFVKKRSIFTDVISVGLLVVGNCTGVSWLSFSIPVVFCGLAGINLTMIIASIICNFCNGLFSSSNPFVLLCDRLSKLLVYIGQHTMFILGTHLLWFKIATFIMMKACNYEAPFLGTYAVPEGASLSWRLLYFICGIGVPILIILIKEQIIDYAKKSHCGGAEL